jgi:hypothetical protein
MARLILLLLLCALVLFVVKADGTQNIVLPSGTNLEFVWSIQPTTYTFALTADTQDFGWLALGVSSSDGLGTSLMTGGPQGGGAIVASLLGEHAAQQFTVREYSMWPGNLVQQYARRYIKGSL